jgi:hypothetical protein
MRVRIVLLALAAAVAACSSHQATQTAYQPTQSEAQQAMVPLVAEEAESVASSSSQLSDAQITKQIIAASIAGYSDRCPCPYSQKRNGASCGRSSAHDRPGGATVICYPHEVTAELIQAHRATMN